MGFQPFYTHERSKLDAQPAMTARGNMLSFDGRLDNHKELHEEVEFPDKAAPDSEIVLAAFDRWGENCFSRLAGDWALVLWSNANRVLYLARDHAGTRTLYYEAAQGRVRWSTHLETFFVDSPAHGIDEAYAASYLAGLPFGELTPYEGIRAVPPRTSSASKARVSRESSIGHAGNRESRSAISRTMTTGSTSSRFSKKL
jgi:asparagine synthase (glutamine-hydrolysing)